MNISDFRKQLMQLIEQSASQEAIEKAVFDFFVTKPIPILQVTHPFLARARMNDNGEVFSTASQLSYNLDTSKIRLQRANYQGQQVFYGAIPSKSDYADCQSTALIETCMEHVRDHTISRRYITIGKWNICRPLTVSILPFSTISCEKNHDFKRANENYKRIIYGSFDPKHSEACQYFIDSLGFMSDIFCQVDNKEKCYPISAAYYYVIHQFFKNKNIYLDGLVYPSANTEAAGMNIALRKEIVDNGIIQLDGAVMITMQRDPSNPKHVSFPLASEEQKPDKEGKFSFKHIW